MAIKTWVGVEDGPGMLEEEVVCEMKARVGLAIAVQV